METSALSQLKVYLIDWGTGVRRVKGEPQDRATQESKGRQLRKRSGPTVTRAGARGSAQQWEKPCWKRPAWAQGHHSPPSLPASAFRHPPSQSQAGSRSAEGFQVQPQSLPSGRLPSPVPHPPLILCSSSCCASLTCRVEVLITAHLPFLWESRSMFAPSSSWSLGSWWYEGDCHKHAVCNI